MKGQEISSYKRWLCSEGSWEEDGVANGRESLGKIHGV